MFIHEICYFFEQGRFIGKAQNLIGRERKEIRNPPHTFTDRWATEWHCSSLLGLFIQLAEFNVKG